MIEKEEWMLRHKNDEKAWEGFKKYCRDCGFKVGVKANGSEIIFAPACGLREEDNRDR